MTLAMMEIVNNDKLSPKDWPYYNAYASKCPQCGDWSNGPKRKPACWSCIDEDTRWWWHKKHDSDFV